MSVGVHLSLTTAHPDPAERAAVLAALDEGLAQQGLPPFRDPRGAPPRRVGRSGTDHHSGRTLFDLAEHADRATQTDLYLMWVNPHWVIWLPRPIHPFPIRSVTRTFLGRSVGVNVGHLDGLARDLAGVAPRLGIPLPGGTLSDDVATALDDERPLPGESAPPRSDTLVRSAWLLLWEATRVARETDRAVVLS